MPDRRCSTSAESVSPGMVVVVLSSSVSVMIASLTSQARYCGGPRYYDGLVTLHHRVVGGGDRQRTRFRWPCSAGMVMRVKLVAA